MKRPAFSLTEVLVVLPLIAVAGLMIALLLPATVRDVPRLQKTLSRQRHIQNFLHHLQEDVDTATALPARIGSIATGPDTLLLQTPNGPLAYQVRDGKVTRTKLANPSADETLEWDIPDGTVEFRRWMRDDGDKTAYAVDVHTALTIRHEERTLECFENHHVFFLHAMPSEPKTKAKP